MRTLLLKILFSFLLVGNAFAGTIGLDDEGTGQGYVYKVNCTGDAISCSRSGSTGTIQVNSTAGTSVALDLGDDASNESSGITEFATTGDTNSIFGEPSADKLLVTLSNNWPSADTADALSANPTDCSATQFATAIAANGNLSCSALADADVPNTITIDLAATATALAANGANCSAGNAPLGVDASGAVESCTDFEEDLSNEAGLYSALSDVTEFAETDEAEVITADWDFGGGGIEIENSITLPGACTVGQIFLDTDATSGQQLYACEGGTFVLQGDGGGGSGDSVTVNSTAIDTTANFLDSIYGDFDIADGGAGGPDDVTFTIEYGQTLAGNPALAVDQCIPFADTSGGGFLCEGSTADTSEQLYRFPDQNSADSTEYIVVADDANVSAVEAGYLDGVTSAIQTQIDSKEGTLTNEAGLYSALSDVSDFVQTTETAAMDFGGATSLEIPNSATPTVNAAGEIALDTTITSYDGLLKYYDGTTEMTVVAMPTADLTTTDNHAVAYASAKSGFNMEAQAGGGGGGATNLTLPVQSAKFTGAFVTHTPAGCSTTASTATTSLDASDGGWHILFDATTDEAVVWQFVMPDNYSSAPTLDVHFAMTSGEANEVEWEGSIMCYTPTTDTADIATASFANCAVGTATTVSATAGEVYSQSITLTDDSCAAGDIVFVWVSTDADDATNDDATGDRELYTVEFGYTGS